MLKLIKYELRKTWFTKVILLALTAIAEVVYLIGLYADKENMTVTGVVLLTILAVGGILVIGLESVVTLHRDMNTRQGYMLFMTPNSCYKILGAKMLECSVSILLAGAFFFALGSLDITLLFGKNGGMSALWDMIRDILSNITVNGRPLEITGPVLAAAAFSLLTSWIAFVTTAYLADVISSALLNGKKMNGVISFILFLVLSWAAGRICSAGSASIEDNVTTLAVYGTISLAISCVMYFVTARIMERKLSV